MRTTDDQERALQASARAAGVTVSRLLAEGGGSGYTSGRLTALRTDLQGIRSLIKRLGDNANQITLRVHCDEIPELEEVPALRDEVRSAVARLDAALERLG